MTSFGEPNISRISEIKWRRQLLDEEIKELEEKVSSHRAEYDSSTWNIRYLADLEFKIRQLEQEQKEYLEEEIKLRQYYEKREWHRKNGTLAFFYNSMDK